MAQAPPVAFQGLPIQAAPSAFPTGGLCARQLPAKNEMSSRTGRRPAGPISSGTPGLEDESHR